MMKTLQELEDRRDQITAEQDELCEIVVWTFEQTALYHELEDERIEIVNKLDYLRRLERLKDENADLVRLIDQMSVWGFDTSQFEERIAQNLKQITKIIEELLNL